MSVLYIFLSILMFLDCLILILLVLLQLPKKEAGAGVAFGGGATDALFGAGSGTALTQLTKYTDGALFVLVFRFSIQTSHAKHSDGSAFKSAVEQAKVPATPQLSSA